MAMNRVKANSDVELKDRLVAINRVTKVTKGGRTFTFAAIVVVGDGKGVLGYGLGKAGEVTAAIAKGTEAAKKSLMKVPVLKGTIPHEMEVKLAGARVLIKPAAPGTGIIAGGVVRSVIGVTGIRNMLSKSLGSTNKVNIAYATIEALGGLVPRDQWLNAEKSEKAPAKEKTEKAPAKKPAAKKPAAKKEAK